MKKASINRIVYISLFLAGISSGNAYAFTIGTQDVFIIDTVRINSAGTEINLAPTLISNTLSSPGSTVTFVGGATFTSTTAFQGKVVDINNLILGNTTVIPGVLSFDNNQFFSIITSSNLDAKAETLGISDSVEIDLTSVFPTDVNVGDVGRMDYTMIQLTPPSDPSSESGLSLLEVAVLRSNEGLALAPSRDNMTLSEIFNQPFVVSDGSKGMKYFGKGLSVAGTTGAGALGGAGVGSAIPALGTTAGAVVGGVAGFLTGLGDAIEKNNDGDDTPDPSPPDDLIPSSTKAVPEPLTILGSGMALGFGVFFKREHSRKQKKINTKA